MTKPELMALIDQRDKLDAEIEAAMAALNLTAKDVKAIRKAAAAKAAAEKTLAGLMGLEPELAQSLGAETAAAPEGAGGDIAGDDPRQDQVQEPKKKGAAA